MPRVVVVEGPAGGLVAGGVAEVLGAELVRAEWKRFPDGEAYVRIPVELAGSWAVVVQTTYPEQDSRLIEAALLLEAARGAGADRVTLVAPYLAYARQDRRFLPGEPISIKVVLRMLGEAGADALVVADIHKPESLGYFPGRSVNVDPSPAFAEALRGELSGDVVVVAPDRGALERARRLASRLGCPFDYLEKRRDRVTGEVTYLPKEVSVEGKTVVLVDDIVSTGGTLAKSARMLRSAGARRVVAAVTHGLLVGGALEKLRGAVDKLYVSNSVEAPRDELVRVVDISRLLGEAASSVMQP